MATERNEVLPDAFVVIGMGKLGGRELIYSSDVDLIYLYDAPDDAPTSTHESFQKFGRRLTSVLSEYTDEGYLYRVDLSTQTDGQAWEHRVFPPTKCPVLRDDGRDVRTVRDDQGSSDRR